MKRIFALLALTCVAACGGKGGLAAANVGIGALASGVSRASGGCYAICTGTDICNTKTGLCDSNPCETCSPIQHCESNGAMPRCVDNPIPTSLTRNVLHPDNPLTLPLEPSIVPATPVNNGSGGPQP